MVRSGHKEVRKGCRTGLSAMLSVLQEFNLAMEIFPAQQYSASLKERISLQPITSVGEELTFKLNTAFG